MGGVIEINGMAKRASMAIGKGARFERAKLPLLRMAASWVTITLALWAGVWLQVEAADPEVSELPRLAPVESERALATFRVRPGFRMELAAAEPVVNDPIAMSFDEEGRLYVVEMRDYSERRDEQLGRIRLLEDRDGDGRFEHSSIFAEGLAWPTAVICYDGGVFVGATPNILYLKDSDGDGRADSSEVIFTGFGSDTARLNVQQLLNSFTWGLDNRIHGATGGNWGRVRCVKFPERGAVELRGYDFSFDPRSLEMRRETGGAQHGMSFDNRGRKFVCSNSAHIQLVMYGADEIDGGARIPLPPPVINIAEDGPAAEVYRMSPDEPWRVIRTRWRVSGQVPGLIEGGGRPSGYFTAATGVMIYRGDAFGSEYLENAFVGDAGSNLIHRKKLFGDGVSLVARRAEDEARSEFVASKDNWFRPVQFANGPDGALYVADMYRETIEHPWSLPPNLKQHLDLNSGNDRGRIYRVVPEGFRRRPVPKLKELKTEELARLLDHANGWHRDTAARLLFERQDQGAVEELEQILTGRDGGDAGAFRGQTPLGRMHAGWALAGLGSFNEVHLAQMLQDPDGIVREAGIRLFVAQVKTNPKLSGSVELERLAMDPDPLVRYRLILALGKVDLGKEQEVLERMLFSGVDDYWMQSAWAHVASARAGEWVKRIVAEPARMERLVESGGGLRSITSLARVFAQTGTDEERASFKKELAARPAEKASWILAESYLSGRSNNQRTTEAGDFGELLKRASQAARNSGQKEGEQMAALPLLAYLPWEESGPVLQALANDPARVDVQRAAVDALAGLGRREALAVLVEAWPKLVPRMRSTVIAALVGKPEGALLLAGAVEAGTIRKIEISPAELNVLKAHKDSAVRERISKWLGPAESRAELMEKYRGAVQAAGESSRGKKIYVERCASCHRYQGEGYAVGPDLESVRANGKEKILASILNPNLEVAPAYVQYQIETKDGETWLGLMAGESGSQVVLRRGFGIEQAIERKQIARLESLNQSLMPEGLEAGLGPRDLADLLEFITGQNR